MSLLKLFCNVDDFWKAFQPHWRRVALARGGGQRGRSPRLSPSEIMTILIHFHQSHYRTFKAYYTEYVLMHRWAEFPALVSYNRFVELTPSVLVPLLAYLQQRQGSCTGLSFVDATAIKVCHNKRIPRHQVFAGIAARGKTSMPPTRRHPHRLRRPPPGQQCRADSSRHVGLAPGPALRAARWGLPKRPRPESNAASSQCSGGLVPSPATLVPRHRDLLM